MNRYRNCLPTFKVTGSGLDCDNGTNAFKTIKTLMCNTS